MLLLPLSLLLPDPTILDLPLQFNPSLIEELPKSVMEFTKLLRNFPSSPNVISISFPFNSILHVLLLIFIQCFFVFVVAKRTSVFDDPTMEIQELTSVIKQDITALNSAVVDLQLISNSRNESGNVSTDTTSHSTTVVDDLKTRLMSTTKEFKDVLTMRTEVLFL